MISLVYCGHTNGIFSFIFFCVFHRIHNNTLILEEQRWFHLINMQLGERDYSFIKFSLSNSVAFGMKISWIHIWKETICCPFCQSEGNEFVHACASLLDVFSKHSWCSNLIFGFGFKSPAAYSQICPLKLTYIMKKNMVYSSLLYINLFKIWWLKTLKFM